MIPVGTYCIRLDSHSSNKTKACCVQPSVCLWQFLLDRKASFAHPDYFPSCWEQKEAFPSLPASPLFSLCFPH